MKLLPTRAPSAALLSSALALGVVAVGAPAFATDGPPQAGLADIAGLYATGTGPTLDQYGDYDAVVDWLVPATYDSKGVEPGGAGTIWPQARLEGPIPCGRWVQRDFYDFAQAGGVEAGQKVFDDFGSELDSGEDTPIYATHRYVYGGDCTPTPSPTPSESTPPEVPTETPTPSAAPKPATLTGSVAVGECLANAPWIDYDVALTDVDGQSTSDDAQLVLTDGTNTQTIELGTLEDGALSGRVLWPGAAVADDGVTPTAWPGWEQGADGAWVETDGNYAWTRGDITATLVVNPELDVDLAYPVATPDCAAQPPVATPVADVVASPAPSEAAPSEAAPVAIAAEVDAAVDAAPSEAPSVEATVEASGDRLPQTGFDSAWFAVGAIVLVGGGVSVLLAVRRRANG